MSNVDVGFYYMNKKYIHAKNEWQYIISWCPFLWTYSNVLYILTTNKNISKLPQFITFFFMSIP
jgi:hypothetical protein